MPNFSPLCVIAIACLAVREYLWLCVLRSCLIQTPALTIARTTPMTSPKPDERLTAWWCVTVGDEAWPTGHNYLCFGVLLNLYTCQSYSNFLATSKQQQSPISTFMPSPPHCRVIISMLILIVFMVTFDSEQWCDLFCCCVHCAVILFRNNPNGNVCLSIENSPGHCGIFLHRTALLIAVERIGNRLSEVISCLRLLPSSHWRQASRFTRNATQPVILCKELEGQPEIRLPLNFRYHDVTTGQWKNCTNSHTNFCGCWCNYFHRPLTSLDPRPSSPPDLRPSGRGLFPTVGDPVAMRAWDRGYPLT